MTVSSLFSENVSVLVDRAVARATAEGRASSDALRDIRDAGDAWRRWAAAPVHNPAWDTPRLAAALVAWTVADPVAVAAFVTPVVTDPRARRSDTPEGLWMLQGLVQSLSDDHDYVLDTTAGAFRLGLQDHVVPFRPLVRPTELAQAIQDHRGSAAAPDRAADIASENVPEAPAPGHRSIRP